MWTVQLFVIRFLSFLHKFDSGMTKKQVMILGLFEEINHALTVNMLLLLVLNLIMKLNILVKTIKSDTKPHSVPSLTWDCMKRQINQIQDFSILLDVVLKGFVQ